MSSLLSLFILFTFVFIAVQSRSKDVVFLRNCDFRDGTYRITKSGTYKLRQDIIFNPRSNYAQSPNEANAYFPPSYQSGLYPGSDGQPGAFRLGFFAAISIEASDVTLDLRGHTMKCDPEFHLQQRFFSLIAVGKTPFIDGHGPSQFGENFEIENIVIKNGKLGLTAHHGIHGNLVTNVEIYYMTIFDFEVAGIHFNGFSKLKIHDCEIGPSLTNVPVVGRYSQARFSLLSLNDLEFSDSANEVIHFSDRNYGVTVSEIIDNLRLGMDYFFYHMMEDKFSQCYDSYNYNGEGVYDDVDYQLYNDAYNIFFNCDGLPDGSALYGILLNSQGDAVNWFGASNEGRSSDATLHNIYVHDLNLKVHEVIAYKEDDIVATGPFKGVLDMALLLNTKTQVGNPNWDYATSFQSLPYYGNMLVDAQIALAMHGNDDMKQGSTVHDTIINWALDSNTHNLKGELVANGDDMHHMDKGIVGIRLDNIDNLYLHNIEIKNINNWSEFGTEMSDNNADIYITHEETPLNDYKYQGTASRGLSIIDCDNVILSDTSIDKVLSSRSNSRGIDLMGDDLNFEVILYGDIKISNINAASSLTTQEITQVTNDPLPNGNTQACGIHATTNSVTFSDQSDTLSISSINGPALCQEIF